MLHSESVCKLSCAESRTVASVCMRSSGIYVPTVYQSDRYEVISVARALVSAESAQSNAWLSESCTARGLAIFKKARRSDRADQCHKICRGVGCK